MELPASEFPVSEISASEFPSSESPAPHSPASPFQARYHRPANYQRRPRRAQGTGGGPVRQFCALRLKLQGAGQSVAHQPGDAADIGAGFAARGAAIGQRGGGSFQRAVMGRAGDAG